MNKFLLFFVLAGTTLMTAYSQAPKGINYQGVARDSEGKPIISKNISVRISILKGATNGEVEYSETHKPQTNQFGLFTLVIGQGTAGTGSFAFVSWAVGNKWLQIEIDPEGGSSFQLAGSQQLMSVPYAFYSEYSGNSSSLMAGQGISINNNVISNTGDGDNSSTNELITGASLTADKKLRITDAGGTKEVDLNTIANTDNQSLTLTGTTLAISGGNTVNLSSLITDSQNLSPGTTSGTNRTINITNGTGVTFDVADNDNNSTNEIQTLTKTGAVLSLSNGGGAITLNDDNASNEIQALTKTGATISLSNGGGSITINDDNATNEIQDLALNTGTNILSLTNDATTVDLTPYKQSLTYTPATNSLGISGGNTVNITSTLTQVLTTNPNAGAIRIQNVGAPSATTDATTKGYVDTAIATAIATNYAFKTSYSFINTGGSFTDSPVSLTEDFDDFNVVGTNRFTAPSAGVYSFNVTGNSTMGGIPIRLKVISGTTTYFDIKRQQSYPLASTVNYHDSIIFKLNAGDTVELVVTSTGLGERVDGFLFGHKL